MAQETKAEKAAREQAEAEAAAAESAQVGSVEPVAGRVKVPAEVGDKITLSGGPFAEPREFVVKGGYVEVDDDNERAIVLGSVPGAVLVD